MKIEDINLITQISLLWKNNTNFQKQFFLVKAKKKKIIKRITKKKKIMSYRVSNVSSHSSRRGCPTDCPPPVVTPSRYQTTGHLFSHLELIWCYYCRLYEYFCSWRDLWCDHSLTIWFFVSWVLMVCIHRRVQ